MAKSKTRTLAFLLSGFGDSRRSPNLYGTELSRLSMASRKMASTQGSPPHLRSVALGNQFFRQVTPFTLMLVGKSTMARWFASGKILGFSNQPLKRNSLDWLGFAPLFPKRLVSSPFRTRRKSGRFLGTLSFPEIFRRGKLTKSLTSYLSLKTSRFGMA